MYICIRNASFELRYFFLMSKLLLFSKQDSFACNYFHLCQNYVKKHVSARKLYENGPYVPFVDCSLAVL